MRIASRVVGVVLALTGLGFIAIPAYVSALGQWSAEAWIVVAFMVGAGIGCVLAGRYFLRLNLDEPDPAQAQSAWRFAPFFRAHHRELKVIASIGLGVSLIRVGAACFGVQWPGRWATLVLFTVLIGLLVIQLRSDEPDANDRLARMRPVPRMIWKAIGTTYLAVMLLSLWSQLRHHQIVPKILSAGMIAILFLWEALFFDYGSTGTGENAS